MDNLRKRTNNVKTKASAIYSAGAFFRTRKGGNTMGTRITEHPILGVPQKGRLVNFTYDGQKIQGYEGEPIAAALKAAGILIHR